MSKRAFSVAHTKSVWFGVLLLALARCPAFPQLEAGTIVVMHYSEERVVIAADSLRITRRADGEMVKHYEDCKITALGDWALFVSSGLAGYSPVGPGDPVKKWDAIGEAKTAFRFAIAHHEKPIALGLAATWGTAVTNHIEAIRQHWPSVFDWIIRDHHLPGGLFVATAEDEPIQGFVSKCHWTNRALLRELFPLTESSCRTKIGNFCAWGRIEIFTEFANATTPRAKRQIASWAKKFAHSTDHVRNTQLAIGLVALTIAHHHPRGEVGGRIVVVELKRGGRLKWIRPTPNCPAD